MFECLDRDGHDGTTPKQALIHLLIAKMDTDGDDKITAEEYLLRKICNMYA